MIGAIVYQLTSGLDEKNFYAFNPEFDKNCFNNCMKKK